MEFTTEIRVRYKDTDQMGVVYHSNYFVWFEVGRTELFRQLGYSYKKLEELGFSLPVVEANCKYRKPAIYDDVLIVKTNITKLTGVKINFTYQIINKDSDFLLVEGFTNHAFINKNGRPINIKKESPDVWENLNSLFSQ